MIYWLFKKYMNRYEKEKTESLANEIVTKLPNTILQYMHER